MPLGLALMQHPAGRSIDWLADAAAAQGAAIALLPEMYSIGYAGFPPGGEAAWLARAEPFDGPTLAAARAAARRTGLHLVATFLERGVFNTAVLVAPDGTVALTHRKIHICDFDRPECALARGDGVEVATIDTPAGPVTVALLICMDREFPATVAEASAKGAEFILSPNCSGMVHDPDVGDVRRALARARGFEATVALAVANYPAPKADGHSLLVDAEGRVLAEAGAGPETLMARLDLARLRRVRAADHFRRGCAADHFRRGCAADRFRRAPSDKLG